MKKIISFLLIFLIFLFCLQKLMTPVWDYPKMTDHVKKTFYDYNSLPKNSINAIFLGTSHAGEEISPLDIYEKSGIITFNLSTSCQPVDTTYLLLLEAFKKQSPKYVFIDVSSFFRKRMEMEEGRSYVLDTLPLTWNKIRYLLSQYKNIQMNHTELLSTIIPLYKYHNFWEKLDKYSFSLHKRWHSEYSTLGFNMYSGISPYDMDWTDLNEIERKMKIRKGVKKLFISDPNIIENETENIFGTIIPDENRQYLYMMKSFCDMNGAQLVLIKNPVITLPIFYRASWTKSKSDSIRNLAYENGIEFIDLQYDYDLRIDWKHDTKDGGMHLNYDGAKKITDFFCNYLIHHDVYGEHNSIINSFLDKYNKHTELAELHLESDFSNYIQKLKTFSDSLCIFMSICDTGMSELLEEEKEQLKRIGLKEFDNAEWSNSYLSIINENKVILDSLSDSGQSFSYVMPNDIKVDLVSRDFLSDSFCSIKIKEVEYALNQRGLNIVVFDKDANMVIDSCVFDFWSKDEHKAIRNNRQLYYMLFDYEFYLCGYQGK